MIVSCLISIFLQWTLAFSLVCRLLLVCNATHDREEMKLTENLHGATYSETMSATLNFYPELNYKLCVRNSSPNALRGNFK